MDRKKTNSVTELVKIVVREVVKEELAKEENVIPGIERIVSKYLNEYMYGLHKDIETCVHKRAYESWDAAEDSALSVEVEVVLDRLAKRHKRTVGAIICRIQQKNLMEGRG